MDKSLQIQAVMTPFPHSVGLNQSVKVARQLMREHSIRHLPVQNGGQLVGVISDRDVNFAIAFEHVDPETMLVSEAYTAEPYIIELTTPVYQVARRMADDHLGCALVTQRERLVGIFTAVDACRTLADLLLSDDDRK